MSRLHLFDRLDPDPGTETDAAVTSWAATEYARGPWDPRHCHGGPVSALLARACEHAIDPNSSVVWQIARLTVELSRPVPVGAALTLTSFVERPGRKVSQVAATLTTDGVDVAKARALRIRTTELALPPHARAPDELAGPPGVGRHERLSWATDADQIAFHSHSAEHRIVEGSWNDPGPVSLWIRLTVDVVGGETPSGVQRAAAAADFGNGVSSAIDYQQFMFINPDLTVHLTRPPVGEWIGMVSHSSYGTATASTGAGMAESALYDAEGRVGRSVQSLLVEPR